jgi:hypothetical protein
MVVYAKKVLIVQTLALTAAVLLLPPFACGAPIRPPEGSSSSVPASVEVQIQGLRSSNPVTRAEAAHALGYMGEKAAPAVPHLIEILGDESPVELILTSRGKQLGFPSPTTVGMLAAEALGDIKAPGKVQRLIQVLRSGTPAERSNAVWALGYGHDEAAVEPLAEVIKAEDMVLSRIATKALACFGRHAVPSLMRALDDRRAVVRTEAVHALADIARQHIDSATRKEIAARLEKVSSSDESTEVRREAAECLANLPSWWAKWEGRYLPCCLLIGLMALGVPVILLKEYLEKRRRQPRPRESVRSATGPKSESRPPSNEPYNRQCRSYHKWDDDNDMSNMECKLKGFRWWTDMHGQHKCPVRNRFRPEFCKGCTVWKPR